MEIVLGTIRDRKEDLPKPATILVRKTHIDFCVKNTIATPGVYSTWSTGINREINRLVQVRSADSGSKIMNIASRGIVNRPMQSRMYNKFNL